MPVETKLWERIEEDPYSPVADLDALNSVIDDLEGTGHVTTEEIEGERMGTLSKEGVDALSGPIPNEPPPLEGEALAAAEAHNEALAEEDAKAEEASKAELVERLEGELAEAKAEVKG